MLAIMDVLLVGRGIRGSAFALTMATTIVRAERDLPGQKCRQDKE